MGGKNRGHRRNAQGSGGDSGRKRRRYASALPVDCRGGDVEDWLQGDSDSDSAALHIGGLRVFTGKRANRPHRRSGKQQQAPGMSGNPSDDEGRPQHRMSDSGGSMDEFLQDYAQNLLQAEEDDSEHHETEAEESRGIRSVVGMFAFLRTGGEGIIDPAEGRPPEDIGAVWSSEEDDSDWESDDVKKMRSLYPVQVRAPRYNEDDDPMAAHLDVQERRRRKLLPGEKKQLRKEKIVAKRAARAASKGFNPIQINEALKALVARKGDVHAFPPMGKTEMNLVQRIAGIYGLKSSVQGSGNKRFVLIRVSPSTAMPGGVAMAEIQELVQQHFKLTKFGETIKAAAARNNPNSMLPAIGASSSSRVRNAAKPRSRGTGSYSKPVGFVRSHVQTTDNPVEVIAAVEVRSPAGGASRSGAAAPGQGPESATRAPQLSPLDQGYINDLTEEDLSDPERSMRSCLSLSSACATAGLGYGGPSPPADNEGDAAMEAAAPVTKEPGLCTPEASEEMSWRGAGEGTDPSAAPSSTSSAVMEAGAWQGPGKAPTKAAAKKARKKAEKQQRRAERRDQEGGGARLQSPSGPGGAASGGDQQPRSPVALQYGGFEVHTTGFGSRMLARMGFAGEGAGLGAASQGISEPIQATLRPRQLGLGHSGFDGQ